MEHAPPLAGLKVVELARILAGPWVGQTLADLGAQVIKVEAPKGDDTRRWGPPFMTRDADEQAGAPEEEVAVYFHATNRGKSSVTCDFRNPEDLQRLKALIAQADVVVENFKVGGLQKYGLDYNSLQAENPGLIYASISGFGQDGPRADQPGYDFLLQGMTGIMDLTGAPDGPPQKVGVAWIDVFTGLYAVIGIQAALAERARSGLGQAVDLSLFDTGIAVLANQAAGYLQTGQVPHRMGNAHPSIVPYQDFPAKDGYFIITCGNDGQFTRLCEVLGRSELAQDERFLTNAGRVANREALCAALAASTVTWDKAQIIAALEAAKVPCGPINTVAEALEDPQAIARELVVAPEGIKSLRSPIKFSRSPLAIQQAGPRLGQGRWSFDPAEDGD